MRDARYTEQITNLERNRDALLREAAATQDKIARLQLLAAIDALYDEADT